MSPSKPICRENKMIQNDGFDKTISRIVRSADSDVPPELERKIQTRAKELAAHRGKRPVRWPIWIAATACASAFLLAILLIYPISPGPAREVAEIRTEFEIPEKNIKIIFVQRADFPLLEEI